MDIADFAGTSPVLTPHRFLAGDLEGWGVMENPLGGLQRRYSIRATGVWDENERTLRFTEKWTFDDGFADVLEWRIIDRGGGAYAGFEKRLEGEAAGETCGCAFHWRYTRDTPRPGGDSVKLNFDDWFYLIDERVCIVRGTAGRAGLPFAVAHVTYRRVS